MINIDHILVKVTVHKIYNYIRVKFSIVYIQHTSHAEYINISNYVDTADDIVVDE